MNRKPFAFLLAFLLVWAVSAPGAAASGDGQRKARVSVRSLNVRGGPSTDDPVIRSISQGTEVGVVETAGDWSRVILDDGVEGWVASRFLEFLRDPSGAAPAAGVEAAGEATSAAPPPVIPETGEEGGSSLRSALKWGCLAGAGVLGGLAYVEHGKGNDAYDEYKALHHDGKLDEADAQYDETIDHDDNAKIYTIAAGCFAGLFLIQQFVLGGDGGGETAALTPVVAPISLQPVPGGARLILFRAPF
ncbi:MAG: SH3 domain-containing protein [Candidatus Eisenbacteria bacterium]|nr:SH3 domain-containing protein [Candidatus Eisenbacteria bacterium]